MLLKATGKHCLSFFILFSLALYVGVCSYNTLWLEDDGGYMFVFSSNQQDKFPLTEKHISSIDDVIQSQKAHYLTMNGRVVAHTIVQLINPFIPKIIFSLLNAIAYVLFVCLTVIMGLSFRSNQRTRLLSIFKHPLAILYVALFSLFSLMLRFSPTSAMYIWMYDLVLTYLLILLFYKPKSQWWSLLLFPFAIIIGNAHESICIGLALGLLLYGIRNIKYLKINDYTLLIGFALGVLIIVCSPASQNRANHTDFSYNVFLSVIYLRATIVFIILMYRIIIIGNFNRSLYRNNSILIDSFLGCLLFCIIIMNTSSRPLYGAEVLAMILAVSVWPKANINKSITTVSLIVISIIVLIQSIRYVILMNERKRQFLNISEQYASSKNGDVFIEFGVGNDPMFKALDIPFPYGPPRVYAEDIIDQEFSRLVCQKVLNYKLGVNKQLRYVNPMIINLSQYPDSNQIIENVPGNYYAIVSNNNPPIKIIANRSALWGLIDWSDITVFPTENKPDFENDSVSVYSIYDQMMFVGIDSISIY